MALCRPGEGLLFRFESGLALTCPHLVSAVRKALAQAGLTPEDYAGNRFRIGAATTAAVCGLPADTIFTLGRWISQAYQLYIRLPREQLVGIGRTIASAKI